MNRPGLPSTSPAPRDNRDTAGRMADPVVVADGVKLDAFLAHVDKQVCVEGVIDVPELPPLDLNQFEIAARAALEGSAGVML